MKEKATVKLCAGFENLVRIFNFKSDFIDILDDLQILIGKANRVAATSTSNRPRRMDSTVTILCYRLLLYSPAVYTPKVDFFEVCRLGVQIYLQTLVFGFPSCRMFCTVLIRKLQSYVKHISSRTTGGEELPREMLLWLMFLGGIITQDRSTRSWFVSLLPHIAGQLRLHSWDDIKEVLVKFLWIETIHEQLCKDLWGEVIYPVVPDDR